MAMLILFVGLSHRFRLWPSVARSERRGCTIVRFVDLRKNASRFTTNSSFDTAIDTVINFIQNDYLQIGLSTLAFWLVSRTSK